MDMAIDWAAAEGWNPGLDDGKNPGRIYFFLFFLK
jgi:hypothetical protein